MLRIFRDPLRNGLYLARLDGVQTTVREEGPQIKVLGEEFAPDLIDIDALVYQPFDA